MTSVEVLKRGPKRTVLLERPAGERAVVVKRFHDPGPVGRFVDRWRARREDRRQRALRDAGLPTPEPLGTRRRDGHWEALSAFIEGATLDELLDGDARWPVSRSRVARELGSLLAALEVAGFAHRDAHAGNVLIDTAGAPWILDAGHVTRRGLSRTTPERLAYLAELCAGVRERASFGFRRRVYESYWSAPAAPREPDPPLMPATPHRVEDDARARRVFNVQKRLDRWWRDSGVVVDLLPTKLSLAVRVRPSGRYRLSPPLSQDETTDRWSRPSLLVEHDIPCLAPVAMYGRSYGGRVVSAIPRGAVQLDEQPDPSALGTLLGTAHDRLVFVPELAWSDLWRCADGTLLFDAPKVALYEPAEAFTPERRVTQWSAHLPWDWDAVPREDRRAFLLAYARASRHSRAERKALEAEAERA